MTLCAFWPRDCAGYQGHHACDTGPGSTGTLATSHCRHGWQRVGCAVCWHVRGLHGQRIWGGGTCEVSATKEAP